MPNAVVLIHRASILKPITKASAPDYLPFPL